MQLFYLIQHILTTTFVFMCAFRSDDMNQQIDLIEIAIIMWVVAVKLTYLLWRKDEISSNQKSKNIN